MYKTGFLKSLLTTVFCFAFIGVYSTQIEISELEKALSGITRQVEELKNLIPKSNPILDSPVSTSNTNYFLLFRSALDLINRLFLINFNLLFFENLPKIINCIKDFEICIQIFCLILLIINILVIPMETFVFFPNKFLDYFNISFIFDIFYKNIISIFFLLPSFFKVTFFDFISKFIIFFGVSNIQNFSLVFNLIINISFILLIKYFVSDLINEFSKKIVSISSLIRFFDFIFALKILKIVILFLLYFFEANDLLVITKDINNLDLLIIFLTMSVMLFKIKNIFSKNFIRFDIVLKELLIPFISLLFSYYIFEKHDSIFLIRSIVVFFIWPVIYRLYFLLYGIFYSYLRKFTFIYRKSNRDIIKIFLIITNFLFYLTFPIVIVLTMYVFGANITRDLRLFLEKKIILRFIGAFLALFISKILFIFSRYILFYYSEIHSFSKDKQRIETFVICMRYLFIFILSIFTSATLLIIFDYDIGPIFQMLSYLFVALTITAQKLVRDVINGIFMLWENTVKIDDWIEYNGKTAIVEAMSLRYMRVRFDDGILVTIPFHKIDVIKNKTRQNSFIIFNISFSIETDVDLADIAVMEAFNNLKNRDEFQHRIVKIEQRDMADMTSFSYVMQYRVCVALKWQNKVRRAFNRELRLVFLKYGISIATPLVANISSVPSLTTGMPYPDSV